MGNVAIGAMDYIRQKLKGEFFAEIDTNKLMMPDSILVEKGLAHLPRPPRNYFYYSKNPSILFFESETQLTGKAGMGLLEAMMQFCSEMGVPRIFTGAAFSLPVSHREPSEVYGVGSNESMVRSFKKHGIKPMGEGQISGLNGMIIGYAKDAGIDAACLLATMPVYAVNFPNPKASRALVETFMKILRIKIDLKDINNAVVEMEKKMESIEHNLRELFPDRKEAPKGKEVAPETEQNQKMPTHVLDKIERLFREARQDREKGQLLKEELDRWNMYKLYEDRFLNLFKEKH